MMAVTASELGKTTEKKILAWEPWFFMAFGLFHLHRIWGLIDRNSYAGFWISVLENKGLFYFVLMGILAVLCILGIITFVQNRHNNYWWRWIYLFGGVYVLFNLLEFCMDVFCIAWRFCVCIGCKSVDTKK